MSEIQTAFAIPPDYNKRFILHVKDHGLSEVLVTGGQMSLHDHPQFCVESLQFQSICLDWLEEVVEQIRRECAAQLGL